MQADPYTRAILTFIALCLLVIVARGVGVGASEAPPPDAGAERGPWTLQMVRTGLGGRPTLVRLNSITGEVWHLRFGANALWAFLVEVRLYLDEALLFEEREGRTLLERGVLPIPAPEDPKRESLPQPAFGGVADSRSLPPVPDDV